MNNAIAKTVWLGLFGAVFVWSAVNPHDFYTWVLEVLPAVVALVLLIATRQSFPLTPLSYWLILVHAIILMIGGHYTYARVPLFDWLKESLELSRNYYDKLGHLAQGFVPAIVSREILIRKSPVRKGNWLFFLVICICLAISAFYELIEWWVALISGESAEAFLGTQGDVWDTHSDMGACLLGALAALLLLARSHDRQLRALPNGNDRQP